MFIKHVLISKHSRLITRCAAAGRPAGPNLGRDISPPAADEPACVEGVSKGCDWEDHREHRGIKGSDITGKYPVRTASRTEWECRFVIVHGRRAGFCEQVGVLGNRRRFPIQNRSVPTNLPVEILKQQTNLSLCGHGPSGSPPPGSFKAEINAVRHKF